jgi:hypothetical protein
MNGKMTKELDGHRMIVELDDIRRNLYNVRCFKLSQEVSPGKFEEVIVYNYVDYYARNLDEAMNNLELKIK